MEFAQLKLWSWGGWCFRRHLAVGRYRLYLHVFMKTYSQERAKSRPRTVFARIQNVRLSRRHHEVEVDGVTCYALDWGWRTHRFGNFKLTGEEHTSLIRWTFMTTVWQEDDSASKTVFGCCAGLRSIKWQQRRWIAMLTDLSFCYFVGDSGSVMREVDNLSKSWIGGVLVIINPPHPGMIQRRCFQLRYQRDRTHEILRTRSRRVLHRSRLMAFSSFVNHLIPTVGDTSGIILWQQSPNVSPSATTTMYNEFSNKSYHTLVFRQHWTPLSGFTMFPATRRRKWSVTEGGA